jgi:hypothetical protein
MSDARSYERGERDQAQALNYQGLKQIIKTINSEYQILKN